MAPRRRADGTVRADKLLNAPLFAPARKRTDAAQRAKNEIAAAHAEWAANWKPHRDPAAAWIGSPA